MESEADPQSCNCKENIAINCDWVSGVVLDCIDS